MSVTTSTTWARTVVELGSIQTPLSSLMAAWLRVRVTWLSAAVVLDDVRPR